MNTARPSKQLGHAVRQYADELTASVRAVSNGHVRHDLEQRNDAEQGVSFHYYLKTTQLSSATGDLTLIAYQTIAPRANADHARQFSVASYAYHLRNSDGDKLLRWEFAPDLPPSWPHMHLDAASTVVAGKPLSGHHLPTGRVLLEDVLRYLVHDCGVTPAIDYLDTLAVSESWFDQAQWGTARGHRETTEQ